MEENNGSSMTEDHYSKNCNSTMSIDLSMLGLCPRERIWRLKCGHAARPRCH